MNTRNSPYTSNIDPGNFGTKNWRQVHQGREAPDDVIFEAIEIRVMSSMTQNERFVFLYNLIFGRSFTSTSEVIGCSKAYVSKLKDNVILKIKNTAKG